MSRTTKGTTYIRKDVFRLNLWDVQVRWCNPLSGVAEWYLSFCSESPSRRRRKWAGLKCMSLTPGALWLLCGCSVAALWLLCLRHFPPGPSAAFASSCPDCEKEPSSRLQERLSATGKEREVGHGQMDHAVRRICWLACFVVAFLFFFNAVCFMEWPRVRMERRAEEEVGGERCMTGSYWFMKSKPWSSQKVLLWSQAWKMCPVLNDVCVERMRRPQSVCSY